MLKLHPLAQLLVLICSSCQSSSNTAMHRSLCCLLSSHFPRNKKKRCSLSPKVHATHLGVQGPICHTVLHNNQGFIGYFVRNSSITL